MASITEIRNRMRSFLPDAEDHQRHVFDLLAKVKKARTAAL